MFRKMIPLTVAMVVLIGCKKKTESTSADNSDPNATYTLKVREEQEGDKTEVTASTTGVTEIDGGKDQPLKLQEDASAEYTETVLEMKAGSGKPTKLTRAYTKATQYDLATKAAKPLSFVGKTVTIEKKGAGYEFTTDGKKIGGFDSIALNNEFGRIDKKEGKIQDLLPKSAVKVGETWTVESAAVKNVTGGMPFVFDESKSKATGKLTRAYTKDGKPWGQIEFDFERVLDPKGQKGPKGGEANGSVKFNVTLDAVIDGSAPDGSSKMTVKIDVSGTENGKAMKMTADMTRTKTVKSVK